MKIDITKIDGYSAMTAEQKIAALEAYEMDEATEVARLREAVSKSNKDAADWKKKHNALLSEDEQRMQQILDENKALNDTVAELRKRETINNHTTKFLSLGYSEKLAKETAIALADGNIDAVFANQKTFIDSHDAEIKKGLIGNPPVPPAGAKDETMTKAKLQAMSQKDRLDYALANPETYKKIYNGGN